MVFRSLLAIFFSSLCLLIIQFGDADVASTLKAVIMLTRHGDRAPGRTYPLDPYKDYPWPGGFGALTPEGYMQLFQSGEIKSARYRPLLADSECSDSKCHVDTRKIFAISSAVPRCIASATSFLIAFLGERWPSNLLQVIPQSDDEMLAEPGKPCLKHGVPFSLPFSEAQWSIIRNYSGVEPLPVYIAKHTGKPYMLSVDAFGVYDTLFHEFDHGLSLPIWAQSIYEPYIRPLGILSFQMVTSSSYLRVRSGVLLNDMINRLERFIKGDSSQNVIFYSAHDITIAGLTHNLGVIDQTDELPEYGAMLCLELHDKCKDCKDEYIVTLLYYSNYSSSEPKQVEVPGCKPPCDFLKFKDIVKPILVQDYDKACSS